MRYNGIKGIYWYYFSIFVRKRDFMKYERCISCNKVVEDWRGCDAGHFVAASRSRALLFDPMNVHLQCKFCNGPYNSKASGAGYAIGLDRRYGVGTAAALWDRKNEKTKEWNDEQYIIALKRLGVERTI